VKICACEPRTFEVKTRQIEKLQLRIGKVNRCSPVSLKERRYDIPQRPVRGRHVARERTNE
jgi:hypothetical protein